MTLSDKELIVTPLKPGAYEKPERSNPNIPSRKYDNIDKACEQTQIANDGNAYIPVNSMPKLLNRPKQHANYVVDNMIAEEDKATINNQDYLNTAGVVRYLDKNSHQTRNSEEADLNRYGRDSLTRIGDSDQAEAQRRKIDAKVNRMLPQMRSQRGTDKDEITGEPLEKGAAFHHTNNKAIYNNPMDVLDPDQGINVNPETHKEIHSRGIMDRETLDANKESIKKKLKESK